MKSETFFCPHCRSQLKKSAQAWVLGEVQDTPGATYVGIGERAQTVTCPACGGAIDSAAMIAGKYDGGGGAGAEGAAGCLVGVVAILLLIFAFEVRVWIAVVLGIVVGGVVTKAVGALLGTKS
jgi:hypothetical protein